MTATQIGELLATNAEAAAAFLLPGGKRQGREWLAGSVAGESGSSLKVILDGPKAGMWIDFADPSQKGDLLGLWKAARNTDLSTACREAMDWLQVPESVRNERHVSQPKHEEPKAPDQRWTELQATMHPGTYHDLSALAALRRIPAVAGLELATDHGHLWFANVHDSGERHPAWLLTDGSRRHAQARKMDGSPWTFGGSHKPSKSKTIWGTDSRWPVGINEATLPEIALVEGAPDFLAAWHFIWTAGRHDRCRPVAMFGASTSIHAEALPMFSGKTVWLFPHADEAGRRASEKWAGQVVTAGATPRFFDFAKYGVKDLNDLCPVVAALEDCT